MQILVNLGVFTLYALTVNMPKNAKLPFSIIQNLKIWLESSIIVSVFSYEAVGPGIESYPGLELSEQTFIVTC